MMRSQRPNNTFWHSCLQWVLAVGLSVGAMVFTSLPAEATGVYQMPPTAPSGDNWILDDANLISRLNEGKINSKISRLAQTNGNELHLITIHRLDYGETADSFAAQLLERWFPDPETQGKHTLLVLDDLTNTFAIKTGDQSNQLLTDEIITSVLEETMMAPLRQGDRYNQAFLDATDRMVAVLSGQPDPGPPQISESVSAEGTFATAEETEEHRGNATILVIGFLIAATVIPMVTYYLYVGMGS